MNFVMFEVEGGFPPSVFGPYAFNSCEHAVQLPLPDPGAEVAESGGGPAAIEIGEDEQNPIGEGVLGVVWVLGKEGSLANAEVLRPGRASFDLGKEKGEPVVGGVREKGEVSGGETIQARYALRGGMAGLFKFLAGERANDEGGLGVYERVILADEVGNKFVLIARVTTVDSGPGSLGNVVNFGGVSGNRPTWFTFGSGSVTKKSSQWTGSHRANSIADGSWTLFAVVQPAPECLNLKVNLFPGVVPVKSLAYLNTPGNVRDVRFVKLVATEHVVAPSLICVVAVGVLADEVSGF